MSKPEIYDNIEQADGNDLIIERERLIANIEQALGDESQMLYDFEEVVVELTKREEQ